MNPLIKWPGGKSGEINKIEKYIPKYSRYIEPFFGGGALFFYLKPQAAMINDISSSLMGYYELIKKQDTKLYDLLMCYNDSFSDMIGACEKNYRAILDVYNGCSGENTDVDEVKKQIKLLTRHIADEITPYFREILLPNNDKFVSIVNKNVLDKIQRTYKNNLKKPFSDEDLKNNLITGFTSGYYMYFRDVFNDINLGRIVTPSIQYKAANFYFIREYCYGSMFRYNSKGEFNIPYGGMSYNKKNMKTKINNMFNSEVDKLFKNTQIYCMDFESFLEKALLTENDFMFLDPPYDTDFSDYEGREFTKFDQERLVCSLRKTKAQFILIIKNTDFIKSLYEKDFNIISFDKQYTYNVRSRNERDVKHLIITNLPM